jgi:hypothetical protein
MTTEEHIIEARFAEDELMTEATAQAALLAWALPIIRRVSTSAATAMVESTAPADRLKPAA